MAKLTQKQLLEQLKMLKVIKPNQEWALLLKAQIAASAQEKSVNVIKAEKASFFHIVDKIISPRRLVYSFAALLFLVVGFAGFVKLNTPETDIALKSQAALTSQVAAKEDATEFKNNIDSLTQVAREGDSTKMPSAVAKVSQKASQLSKTLKTGLIEESTFKEIAVSLKVLADVNGTDVVKQPEVADLYKTVVESQIADLKKATLTNEQTVNLNEAEQMYTRGEYTDALALLLLINK